jgi:hypothetical protein
LWLCNAAEESKIKPVLGFKQSPPIFRGTFFIPFGNKGVCHRSTEAQKHDFVFATQIFLATDYTDLHGFICFTNFYCGGNTEA